MTISFTLRSRRPMRRIASSEGFRPLPTRQSGALHGEQVLVFIHESLQRIGVGQRGLANHPRRKIVAENLRAVEIDYRSAIVAQREHRPRQAPGN